jgi:hypothetical protein
MYYLPERIFLCEFKYFALKPDFGRGGGESDCVYEPQESRTVLLMTATGYKRINKYLGLISARYDMLIKNW